MDNAANIPGRDGTSDVQRLARLVKGIPFAMLTTRHDELESLRSRPMTLQEADFDGSFWFFTGNGASAAEDIRNDARVNLAFADPKSQRYVSATGVAEISHDREKMKELWNPLYKAWFPLGLDDPELCLLRVQVESADFWETPSSKVEQLVGFAQALTGKGARPSTGTRGHLELGPPWH